jgi:hypothetical protein
MRPNENPPITDIPSFSQINKEFCSNNVNLEPIGKYIKLKIGDKTWEDVQDDLLRSKNPDDKETSLRLQRGRAVIAKCASLLYGAIATGSARNLEEIDMKNAKKDIDMSVPFENIDASNEWLEALVPDPDRTMLVALLGDPISSLPCRSLKTKDLIACTKENVKETSQVMILAEIKHSRKNFKENGHGSVLRDFVAICPGGFQLPSNQSPVYELFQIDSKAEKKEFLTHYPETATEQSGYKSSLRYQVLFYALKNPAYYLQPGSIRKWVIEREKEFLDKMQKESSEYVSSKQVRELEAEGAALEQWIQAMRHKDSFYYRNKYLFRAMEHIGFDIQKNTPELFGAHKFLKKTRPAELKNAFEDLNAMIQKGETKEEKTLSKWNNGLTESDFSKLILAQEKMQTIALLKYFQSRRKQKENIWSELCRE